MALCFSPSLSARGLVLPTERLEGGGVVAGEQRLHCEEVYRSTRRDGEKESERHEVTSREQ